MTRGEAKGSTSDGASGSPDRTASRPEEDVRSVLELLREARAREAGQVAFYRRLARAAGEAGRDREAARLRELRIDEERQLSALGSRLREFGSDPGELSIPDTPANLQGWEAEARAREAGEVAFYKAALAREMDERTRVVLQGILEVERSHRESVAAAWRST